MNYCRIWFLLLVLFVTIAACAFFKSKETPVRYTWASFFNKGCGPVTDFIENENQKATLVYHCLYGEEITQSARFYKIEGGVSVWESQRLPDDQLYNLSNSKCQASLVFLGSDHATINFTCAILNLTVGYDIANRVIHDDSIQTHLIPNKVLITYGDGTQEFFVDGEQLIPLGPFKPFPHRLKISYIQQNTTISRSNNL
ncbi:MAG: hypothetical protein JSW04_09830 [Desulfobacterales bacterium]|nr:MAG: hypothetical protein JSW04_09830 [Desulfobacterales bacterium]